MSLTEEHLEGCMRISATEIKAGVERLLNHKQRQMPHKLLILLKKIIERDEPSCNIS
jgi:hypothetical protein